MFRTSLALALILVPWLVACNLRANADCATLTSNSASGVTTCGTESCTAGTYCSNPAGNVCANGCKSDDNCGPNQKCDLSTAQTDLGGNKVGACVTEPLGSSSACGDAATSVDGGDAGDAAAPPKDGGRD